MSTLFANTLTICIDAGNLSGYLALAPTLALLREFDVSVGWLPLTAPLQVLSSRQPGEAAIDPLAAYKARRALAREKWTQRELERDCARLGISIEQGARQFDASLAGMGLLFVAARGGDIPDYLDRVYRRAYRDGADIDRLAEIAGLVADDAFRAFVATSGRDALDSVQHQLLEAGVFISPAYVYDGEVFQGRQHLPLLAGLLPEGHR